MLVFACISPHPPIILPNVGSEADRAQVKKTILALEKLGKQLSKEKPEVIVISSPHPDWGIEVPLHFLVQSAPASPSEAGRANLRPELRSRERKVQSYISADSIGNWKLEIGNYAVFPILTTLDPPKQHFLWGKKFAQEVPQKLRWAWVASGDMSHRLKENGPYGLHPSGPKFDREFIERLKKKDISGILNLPERLVEEAGECGLRSFCMLLGALEGAKVSWKPEILSYEGPFGVGYLVAKLYG